jgi:peptidoglycan hydrolase-like protein with peptidoglycan-binding domain
VTDEPILRRGDCGEWVSHLQQVLAKAGQDPGPVDGEFGERTQASVWAFQRAFGLVVDGVIGADTWFNLHKPQSASATAQLTTAEAASPAGAGAGEDLWAEVVPGSRPRRLRLPAAPTHVGSRMR